MNCILKGRMDRHMAMRRLLEERHRVEENSGHLKGDERGGQGSDSHHGSSGVELSSCRDIDTLLESRS